jgi:hypothetical protein
MCVPSVSVWVCSVTRFAEYGWPTTALSCKRLGAPKFVTADTEPFAMVRRPEVAPLSVCENPDTGGDKKKK